MADVVYDRWNILLSRLMGADVRLDPAGFDIGIRQSWEQALAEVEERGGKPYAIPAGASDHPLGGLGFARWAHEVAEQEGDLDVFFDTIVVCSVTGSTQAGMIAGFAAQERPRDVLGIDGSATVEQTWDQVARIARRPRTRSASGATWATTRSSSSTSGTRTYGIPTARRSRRSTSVPASRSSHRPRLRGEVDGGADRPRALGPDRARFTRPYAHLGGQPALNAYAGVRVVGRQPNGQPEAREELRRGERDDLLHPLTLEREHLDRARKERPPPAASCTSRSRAGRSPASRRGEGEASPSRR